MPLEGKYSVAVALAILALSPFIIVSSGYALYAPDIMADLHVSREGLEVIAALATAGYAFGALLGGDFGQRFPQKYTFLTAEALFVLGCILSAVAPGVVMYGAGRDLQGFATGILLVSAVPPVIQNFPASKLPITAVFINIGFFGGVCAGPLLGGAVWLGHEWRWFYAGLGGLGAIALVLGVLGLSAKPANRGMPFDYSAVGLALVATVLVFFGSAELSKYPFRSYRFALPVGIGLICLIVLIVMQYNQEQPLSPIKKMWTTLPIIGTLTAMFAGGSFISFVELAEQFHMRAEGQNPWHTGLLLWPLIPGVLLSAVVFGAMIRTRLLPMLILIGMACLVGGGALTAAVTPARAGALTLAAAGLLGFAAGATVSPALMLAGFSLPSKQLGGIFALIEMVRSVCDYVLAPVIIRIAVASSPGSTPQVPGLHEAAWITVYLTIAFTLLSTALYWLGGVRLRAPDLEAWLGKNRPAVESPRLLARLRR